MHHVCRFSKHYFTLNIDAKCCEIEHCVEKALFMQCKMVVNLSIEVTLEVKENKKENNNKIKIK